MALYLVICTPVIVAYAVWTGGKTVQIHSSGKPNLFVACMECLYSLVYKLISKLKETD